MFFLLFSLFLSLLSLLISLRRKVTKSIGFLHPFRSIIYFSKLSLYFSDAGGGGERVLWTMIKTLQSRYPTTKLMLFSSFNGNNENIMQNLISRQFGLPLSLDAFTIQRLRLAYLLDPKYHPLCTLFSQNIASIILVSELLLKSKEWPHVIIDTHGLPFCYPIFWLVGIKVITYLHYPIIR
jgi:alpha-1,2-mannosyltransferase